MLPSDMRLTGQQQLPGACSSEAYTLEQSHFLHMMLGFACTPPMRHLGSAAALLNEAIQLPTNEHNATGGTMDSSKRIYF